LSSSILRAEVPRKLSPLLVPARYKGAFGGRGGSKSHFFAEQLIIKCYREETRAACIREVQNTIRESVRQLLVDKIQKLGLGAFFECLENEIRGANGSLIIFRGMQSYNAESIKSLEGYDVAWVEEAQSLSDVSLRLLRPTIRKEGSEIWFSWNPRHDTDAVDKFLRGPNRPRDAIVVEVNWNDNPWFPDVLQREKDEDYAADPEMADHVWGGNYEIVSEGAYYARLIVDAERQGRVGHFPYDPSRPVATSWDIGIDDYAAVWFWQSDGTSATVIDYYEANNQGFDEIIANCMPELLIPPWDDEKWTGWTKEPALVALGRAPWKFGVHYLPHDVAVREPGAGGRSRVESLIRLGVKNIHKGVRAKPGDRVAAVRRIMPSVYFNQTQRVQHGIKRLRRYRRKWNDSLQTYTEPERDDNTHGADAFGEFAINSPIVPKLDKPAVAKKVDIRTPTLKEIVSRHDKLTAGGPSRRI
jgi:phage terminase large subunit